jgi:hypothetical protein
MHVIHVRSDIREWNCCEAAAKLFCHSHRAAKDTLNIVKSKKDTLRGAKPCSAGCFFHVVRETEERSPHVLNSPAADNTGEVDSPSSLDCERAQHVKQTEDNKPRGQG